MNYACWKKCDFQLHTPRDPNWKGARILGIEDKNPKSGKVVTAEDVETARNKWAELFVDSCVKKGLQAIAITDHHEMIMIPYVQKQIAKRLEHDTNFDLWLFPGMELTASGGKQCLIIFDADLSENWRQQAQGILGIEYADLNEKSSQSPKVKQLSYNYADIGQLLDGLNGLRGKYIILPNVSQGNSHTVLVNGEHADFRRMPYVGGYLDTGQNIGTIGTKNRTRLSGKDSNWSERCIYPIPTSDSRQADYSTLGTNNAWIKLAEPTAEAIRQAFLGCRSRISIEQPELPSLSIAIADIKGSAILDQTILNISPEFSSVIGGRGSGKSSFLEYVAFGLGRSCYDVPRDHYSGTERMSSLVKDTIVSKGAIVSLTIVQDGAEFQVVRGSANAYQPQITYPDGSTQMVTVRELRALFPAVVYSQGELSEIGKQAGKKTQLSDLLQFVDSDYKRQDEQFSSDIETAKNSTKSAVQKLVENWSLQSKLRKMTTSRDSLKQRVTALEKTLPTLSKDDQAIVAYYENATEFESKRLQASKHADQIVSSLDSLTIEFLSERNLDSVLTDEAKAIQQEYADLFKVFTQGLTKLQNDVKAKRSTFAKAEDEWGIKFKDARSARDAALEKLGEHKTVTSQIIKLREDITQLTNDIGDLDARLKSAGDPSEDLKLRLRGLKEISERRADQTREWAKEIENLSSGKIKAAVDNTGNISEVREAVEALAAKTGSQEGTRMREIEEVLASDSVWDLLDQLRSDCHSLLYWQQIGAATGEERPDCTNLMKILGDTDRIRTSIAELMDTSRVEAISAAVPKPEITLSYCDGAKEISFEKASEGQRAAALLFMLLEQPGGPLIIDQPEGDLDNKIISELTDKLHTAKQHRQLIFASHNANIVVNGSSELVGHLEVSEAGERKFECSGAIDDPSVCLLITSTMEGGEKAFKDRQDKYGY